MSLRLFACGDIVNSAAKQNFIDNNLQYLIANSDFSICNFEAPIRHFNMRPIKKAGPCLSQAKESIKYLDDTGFAFVSLANNHIYDYGENGLKETIKELQKYDIKYIGAGFDFEEAYESQIIEKNGNRIGLLAACENEFGCLYEEQNRGGYAWLFHYKLEEKIVDLKKSTDFVVLMVHAGVENIDIPIKEWRDRYKRLCDIGVDVVIGHHPHVPQGYEKYNNSLIFYSLGNFYFDTASFENKSDDSYSVILDFTKDAPVSFEIVYHKKINGQTCLVDKNNVSFNLEYLNSLLANDYNKLNDDISVNLLYKYYYNYYAIALNALPINANLILKLKWLIKIVFSSKQDIDRKNLLLLHNIRVDSHRFLVQRALSIISERKK
ncbi:MAG TPA: CapA family protein [Bacilli bacterium]|nr:CapA family protein [Bacilli bacterium]